MSNIGYFTAWDYVVFAVVLFISAAIGVYFAYVGIGKETSQEFLAGGRSMTAVPVALSLTASFMSAVTILGTPADVYRYGAMYLIFAISYALVVIISAEIFLPVFYRLEITSTYEYLELRFNRSVRILGTIIFIIEMILYTGIVIYAPALALNQVSGFNLWGAMVATGLVCIFYCTLGGLKAVIWTDAFQIVIMLGGFIAVIVRGIVVQGGIQTIINDSYYGGRLNFWDFDPHPLRRHTFWTIVIGGTFLWTGIYGVNQSQVQRYIACKTKLQAKLSLYINLIGLWAILICAVLCGLILYSVYKDCDPWTAKEVSAPDQLMPFLVLTILKNYPGVPGLFVACAYSGTLSTVSSSINALAAVTVEDLIKPYTNLSEKKLAWISRGMSALYGILCIAMAAVASYMGSVIQAALSIFAMVGGPLLGLFSLGMFFPFANPLGAIVGLIVGFSMSLWAGIGAQVYPPLPERSRPLPLSTSKCNFTTEANWISTTEMTMITSLLQSDVSERPALADYWYSLSYLYFSILGTLITLVVGVIISLITGGLRQNANPDYLFGRQDCSCDIFYCHKSDERYGGNPNQCRAFLNQVGIFLEMVPRAFPNDRSKVGFIISLLSDKALAWANPLWETGKPIVNSYSDLAAEVGWNNEALVAIFSHGLADHIKDEIAARDIPATLEELMSYTILIDTRLKERSAFRERLQKPPVQLEFSDMFDKVRAGTLPPHRSYDCAIDLQPGAIPPKGRTYPLSVAENKAMEEYVCPVPGVQKKGGELRPCVDYRGLNHFTVKNAYPITLITELLYDVLREYLQQSVVVYLDNILIHSPSLETHHSDVARVLRGSERMGYFASWRNRFVGFTNYYRKFIINFSSIVKPIMDMTQKEGNPNCWSSVAARAFELLNTAFTSDPILLHHNPALPFVLEVYASVPGLGQFSPLSREETAPANIIPPDHILATIRTNVTSPLGERILVAQPTVPPGRPCGKYFVPSELQTELLHAYHDTKAARHMGKNQMGIKISFSSAYHPQSNGAAERSNQALEQFLCCYVSDHHDNWADMLPWAEFACNSANVLALEVYLRELCSAWVRIQHAQLDNHEEYEIRSMLDSRFVQGLTPEPFPLVGFWTRGEFLGSLH
ncbi:sodium-coupled monocarboxylate transporter 1-like [Spea bombifrons]|uniref:sodium-coupled monocarboxylate transporter 1-like n=1 Tax=Spea bombifrons TaxID=233779 RepID=UPI00234916A7|nr:sodium-coupled monocarboxylate transporter 1-like [Spea bombifrons]